MERRSGEWTLKDGVQTEAEVTDIAEAVEKVDTEMGASEK